jgi:RHS repeat-associated protein
MMDKKQVTMSRKTWGIIVGLTLASIAHAIPAYAQTSFYVYLTDSGAGFCPSTPGSWFTFEAAAQVEFAACQGAGTFTSPGWSLGGCAPSGYPTSSTTSTCSVLYDGNVQTAIYASSEQTPNTLWGQGAPPPLAGCNCPTPTSVGDPISPGMGQVFKRESDITFAGAYTSIGFARFYNNGDTSGTDMGPAWRHSYDRSIVVNYSSTLPAVYPGASATVSPQYSSAATACVSGFAAIQSQVNGWQSATAAYTNNVCVISTAAGVISTMPIYSAYGTAPESTPVEYDVIRDDGQTLRFTTQNGLINNPPGISLRLAQTGSGFTLTDDNDNVETYNTSGVLQSITSRAGVIQTIAYDANGRLSGITDSFGNSLSITRNSANTIASVTLNGATTVHYAYDTSSRLATVTNADNTTRNYLYQNNSFPIALTGLVDESGTQLSTWTYDTQGRASSSQEAGGADAVSLVYNANGTVTATDALGAVRTFTYTRIGDINQPVAISGSQCPTCSEPAATSYDAAGWVASRTDYNGNLTCYANDPVRGLELVRVEGFAPGSTCPSNLASYTPASGTVQRKISTTWSSTYRLPTLITEFNRTTAYSYDGYGNVLTKTITDTTVTPNVSRTWTYTYYNSGLYGQVETLKGPRTDLNSTTSYTYFTCTTGTQCGQPQTVTDPVGNVTTYETYNGYGQPLTLSDPNSVPTTLTYDARSHLTSRQVSTETTGFSYYPTGLLDTVTMPDSSTLQYEYDGAHRLTKLLDGAGNSMQYTLDAMGNRTAESAYDPSNTLDRTLSRVFNSLSELYQLIGAAGTTGVTTTYGYDSNGNQTTIDAPLSRNTINAYDALNRLEQITDPNSGKTYFGYDAENDLASVKDPRSLTTSYTYNGFSDLAAQVSPDTGTTTNTYDSGGNLSTAKDARSKTVTYSYDAANRVTQAAYGDQTIAYTYDAGTNGKGRLTGASDANHSMAWTYDTLGRVTKKSQTVNSVTKSVQYAYTNADLTTLTTPSGQSVTFTYSDHRVSSIAINGTTLLSGVLYEAFGPARGWSWGNGTSEVRLYNTDGNPSQFSGLESTTYTLDNAFRITGITNTSNGALSWTYGYDLLDRLNSASKTGTTQGWTFDANGNRLTQTGTTTATYTISTTNNQIKSITGTPARTYTYDADGNVLTFSSDTFTFNNRGRMSTAKASGSTTGYVYNALGQRIMKSGGPAGTVLYWYDEAGHLLGEYSSTGALVQETVWMGDIPVATIRPNGSSVSVYYVHADHLSTPKMVTQPSTNKIAWRWDQDPFGTAAPNQNPAGLGTFVYNLRFPGQYYDTETGLNYNYFRDYDPATGRYGESDPIGLWGGINTYIYAQSNPLNFADATGLKPWYGNYCGPGNNPGPPINCVDAACKSHDACYDRCGLSAGTRWLPPGLWSSCAAKCDNQLIKDVASCVTNPKGCATK